MTPSKIETNQLANVEKAKKFSNLATRYENEGNLNKAKQAYELAIKHDPNPDYYYNYAGFLRKTGDLKEAEFKIKIAIELQPDDSLNYAELGLIYVNLKDWDKAIDVFKKSCELNVQKFKESIEVVNPSIFYNLGNAHMDKGKLLFEQSEFEGALYEFSECSKSYNQALANNPTDLLLKKILKSADNLRELRDLVKEKITAKDLEDNFSNSEYLDSEESKKDNLTPTNPLKFSSKIERTGFGRGN